MLDKALLKTQLITTTKVGNIPFCSITAEKGEDNGDNTTTYYVHFARLIANKLAYDQIDEALVVDNSCTWCELVIKIHELYAKLYPKDNKPLYENEGPNPEEEVVFTDEI